MILLDPRHHAREYPDDRSKQIMLSTIEFFESKGLDRIKADDRDNVWYQDFLDFQASERVFATLLTPSELGGESARWDTWRICDMNEILSFYGLHYWYTWQVTILGLGPIWQSKNEAAKERAAAHLEAGDVFAYGLSEQAHGADIYSTSTRLVPTGEGGYLAAGEKYYIGNANVARMVSTFGKIEGGGDDDYAFFVVDSQHSRYRCLRNVVDAQSYVANFAIDDYPVSEEDVLQTGPAAWDACLNTVNIGKFNLGWASIGIATHAFYEAIQHAYHRKLYGMRVTDFPHARRNFVDAYARLVAMKLVGLRACDYMRSATREDRRYLLYSPIVKMKVTTQGERVVDDLWDVIAARGFENQTWFEMASRDIRALPRLEGTVHVNIALIVKFMAAYFFQPVDLPPIPTMDQPVDDEFLFDQGPAKGLSKIRFHDPDLAFGATDLPNVAVFREQVAAFKELLAAAAPDDAQRKDVGFLLAFGEIFAVVVYAQLVLENAPTYEVAPAVVDQIFDVLVREVSAYALALHNQPASTPRQMEFCLRMLRKPVVDEARFLEVWNDHVVPHADGYRMRA
jgi:acyl-CoA dehydrogenase